MHKNDNIAKLKTDREVLIVALQMAKDYLEDQQLNDVLLRTIQTTLALVNSKIDAES